MIPLWLAAGLRVLLVALAHYRAITRSVFVVTRGGIITKALAAAVMETIARRKQPGEERKNNRVTGRSELRSTRLRPHRNEHRYMRNIAECGRPDGRQHPAGVIFATLVSRARTGCHAIVFDFETAHGFGRPDWLNG